MFKIKLNYPPEAPLKPIPFSKGLGKIPRRYYGWLALFCALMMLVAIAFSLYIAITRPEPGFHPYVVNPGQVSRWLATGRSLLLIEIWEDEQAPQPLLKGALRVSPLPAHDSRQRQLIVDGFINRLPAPRPWLIFYSLGPDTEKEVTAFIKQLSDKGFKQVYALSGTPEEWEARGLLYQAQE